MTDWKKEIGIEKTHTNAASHYSAELDCLVELIQNSFKSIQERFSGGDKTRGEIEIRVNRAEKKIIIIDNGKGFPNFEQAIGIGKSGWKKPSPEAGFGYGLTTMIMMSEFASIDSVDEKKIRRKIEFKNSHQSFWGKKKKPWNHQKMTTNPFKGKKYPSTTITLKGTKRAYSELWELIDKWSKMVDIDGDPLPVDEMLEQALLWHSALGYSRVLWGKAKPPNILYTIKFKPKKGATKNIKPKKVGHPLVRSPPSTNVYNVNTKTGTKDSLSVLTANKISNFLTIPRLGGAKVKIRIHAVSMTGEAGNEVIDKMKENFDSFPLYNYSTDRYFLSINGFNQAVRLQKPDKGGNKAIHNNALFVIDIENGPGLDAVIEAGRNKLAYGLEKKVEEYVYEWAVKNLDKEQQGKTKEKFSGEDSMKMARKQGKNDPWPWDSSESLGLAAGPRLPNDESYVVHALGALIGSGYVEEIELITCGGSGDHYDLMFWNRKPAEKLTKKLQKKISPPLKGKTHADIGNPMIGELKTTLVQFCKDIDGNRTRKKASDIEFLVCWERGGKIPNGWQLKNKKIGAGKGSLVRCSNYKLTKAVPPGQASVRMEVLVLSEYLEMYHKEKEKHSRKEELFDKDPKKNPDPGDFIWPSDWSK